VARGDLRISRGFVAAAAAADTRKRWSEVKVKVEVEVVTRRLGG
jgi:hypothetical protein